MRGDGVTTRSDLIAGAFRWACLAELDAPKPGNVHVFADGHRMTAAEFAASADAAAPHLSAAHAPVGTRILRAVEATIETVGSNTNLGIVLLCAPLATAAENDKSELRASLTDVLQSLDANDAELAYRAIALAAPAGLGRSARHDVFAPATVSLLDAMAEASDRDRVAAQYVTNFSDIFEIGLPLFEQAVRRYADLRWATLATYLEFLSAFPDTHIVRKCGADSARKTRDTAALFQRSLHATQHPDTLLPELLAWDAALKTNGINPGTSADLTVATLFASRLKADLLDAALPRQRNSD
jgi:triphosphoribosyl-dephospho-CoA synthase